MSDLNDLSRPVTTDTEPNVLDTLRAHLVRAATWSGWGSTANKVAGIMSSVTAAVSGGRSLRLYRRNDANTADEEVVTLPGISVGGNAGTASAAQAGSTLRTEIDAKAPLNSPGLQGTPTAPTASFGANTLQVANTAFVQAAVANVVSSSPAALDTLNELASALGNDPNFASSTATALGNRVVRQSANRPGVTKLYRNDSDDAYNVQTSWTGVRWRLKGFAGDTYHAEAEVGYADVAGSASANDVYTWAKQATKPSYSKGEVGLGNVDNTADASKSVNYANTAGNGGVTSVNGQTGSVSVAGVSGSGSAPYFAARAWVNFNGQGTVAIRASANVTSIVDNGTGDYTVNFAIAMPDANYAAIITAGFGSGSRSALRVPTISDMFAGSVRYNVSSSNGVNEDVIYQNISIFR